MAKPKHPLGKEAVKKFYGEGGGLNQYFKPVAKTKPAKQRGRPKKQKISQRRPRNTAASQPSPRSLKSPPELIVPTASRPRDSATAVDVGSAANELPTKGPMPESAAAEKSKATRINWSLGEHCPKMKQAVHDWLNQTKAFYKFSTGEYGTAAKKTDYEFDGTAN